MPYFDKSLRMLVVEDNIGDFVLFEAYIQQTNLSIKHLYHATTLAEVTVTGDDDIDIAFLDLTLPDSGGVESFISLNERLPHVPIVVLSGLGDQRVALECIALGAQDYLQKNELNERLLEKSVYYSMERKKNMEHILSINRQYELIGSVTNDVIWNWNLDSNEINCAKKSFLGYGEKQIDKGLEWWMEKMHPEDKEAVAIEIANVLEKRSSHFQVEYRFRSGSGSYQYLFSRGVIMPRKNDEPNIMVGAIMDITERKKLEQELLQSQINLQRQMTEAMIQGEEKQKEEIGKELHDNINQVLATVKLYIDTAIHNESMRDEMLLTSKNNIMYAINEVRKLSHTLVPPSLGDLGLVDAVKELTEELNRAGLFKIEVIEVDMNEARLSNSTKLMLFRIVQEQMNNIMKYAQAKQVWLSFIMTAKKLVLLINDDGLGFDPKQKTKGIGFKNMESRVAYLDGHVQLDSVPGHGATLKVSIPL